MSSESIFLFELFVEELTSYIKAKTFRIKAKFGDVFSVKLRDPNELIAEAIQPTRGNKNRKFRIKNGKLLPPAPIVPSGQTVMIASDIESLVTNMMKFPLELSLFTKDDPFIFGLVEIPWNSSYITYLNTIAPEDDRVVLVREIHRVFDYRTSKCVAVLKLKIKINQMKTNLAPTTNVVPLVLPEEPPKVTLEDLIIETGTIKTIYSGGKRKNKSRRKRSVKYEEIEEPDPQSTENTAIDSTVNNSSNILDGNYDTSVKSLFKFESNMLTNTTNEQNCRSSLISLVRSQTDLDNNKLIPLKRWSSTSIEIRQHIDTLNYIFGNFDGPFGNKVYCVNYFTVEKDVASTDEGSPKSAGTKSPETKSPETKSPPASSTTPGSPKGGAPTPPPISEVTEKSEAPPPRYTFKVCGSKCKMLDQNKGFDNVVTLDLTEEVAEITDVVKCAHEVRCDYRKRLEPQGPREPATLVDLSNYNKVCCEELRGGVKTQVTVNKEDPCFCTCECTFGFIKKTTYCDICGGYEKAGYEIQSMKGGDPFPCPVYHKLAEVTASKKRIDGQEGGFRERAKSRVGSIAPVLASAEKKSIDSDRDSKKGKKRRKKDDRFKFNYGYKAPQIGHSRCALPCTGHLNPVPKHMGWLWTADNIPGLKVRPNWRPGAANKHVVRMLRIARFPEQVKARRKRDTGKKKRPLKRPLLIVQKTDGEYTVTMETMRQFNRPRAPNQYPYEDKPVVTYTVGRTEEENRERRKRKERAQRRLEREQKAFIQSAFTDMCKEICQKTYEQALGLMPFAEDAPCPCYPIEPDPTKVDLSHSCSCTESTRSSESATDDDEWIVEFTPPNAYFNPAYKGKKISKVDRECQYTYLDYRVKLLDRLGNPVPRFFTGTNGKQECSDLGGFWGPDGKWLEINVDGFVAPDGRWAPHYFYGPDGDQIDAEGGKFQLHDGTWLVVGVDGYIDGQNKWRYYGKRKHAAKGAPRTRHKTEKGKGKNGEHGGPSEQTFSCFGEASPRTLSQMGIVGHGHDRRLLLSTLEQLMKAGEDITLPQTPKIPTLPKKKGKKHQGESTRDMHAVSRPRFADRTKCKHSKPSDKGVTAIDPRGRKTYFKAKDYKNPRPHERLQSLGNKGVSVSSFHVPCYGSFLGSEAARQHQYEHILQHNARVTGFSPEAT